MSDGFWMAFFGFLTSLLAAVMSWLNRRNLQHVEKKVQEVKKATNSLAQQLVETTRTEAHAAGIKEEKERQEAKNGAK